MGGRYLDFVQEVNKMSEVNITEAMYETEIAACEAIADQHALSEKGMRMWAQRLRAELVEFRKKKEVVK